MGAYFEEYIVWPSLLAAQQQTGGDFFFDKSSLGSSLPKKS